MEEEGGGEEEDNGAGRWRGRGGWVGEWARLCPPFTFGALERRAMCTSASLFASALRRSVSVQKKNSTQFYVHSNSSCNFGPKV